MGKPERHESHWTSCDIRTYTPCSVHLLLSIYKKPCVRCHALSASHWTRSCPTSPLSPSIESLGLGSCCPLMIFNTSCFFIWPGTGSSRLGLKAPAGEKNKNKILISATHTNKRGEWKVSQVTKWLYYPSKGRDWNSSLVYETIMVIVEYTSLRIRCYFICLTS